MKICTALSVLPALSIVVLAPVAACASQEKDGGTSENAATEEVKQASEDGASTEQAIPADPQSFPEVVARVNEAEITKGDLMQRVKSIRARLPSEAMDDSIGFYRQVVDDLVAAELLYQSSKLRGLVPDAAEVEQQMDTLRARFDDGPGFEEALGAQSMTEETLRDAITRDLSIQKLVETEILADVEIGEESKRAFYEENQAQMIKPEQVKVRHILVQADENATPEEREEARQKSETLHARLEAGESFATLARENSDDAGSKDKGGQLPWIGPGDTVPPFEKVAYALTPGEISDVVETQYGYHIIKLVERRDGSTVPYEQAEERIEEFLRQRAVQERLKSEIETLKDGADLEILI